MSKSKICGGPVVVDSLFMVHLTLFVGVCVGLCFVMHYFVSFLVLVLQLS